LPKVIDNIVQRGEVRGVNVTEGSPLVRGEFRVIREGLVAEFRVFHQMRNSVQPETIGSLVQPELQDILLEKMAI